jgi:hypothetical protein
LGKTRFSVTALTTLYKPLPNVYSYQSSNNTMSLDPNSFQFVCAGGPCPENSILNSAFKRYTKYIFFAGDGLGIRHRKRASTH